MIRTKRCMRVAVMCGFLFVCSSTVHAATLQLSTQTMVAQVGVPLTVFVELNGDGQAVNALESSITYPNEMLTLTEVSDAQSVVNFWVTPARRDAEELSFSGIIPGGFTHLVYPDQDYTTSGTVLSLTFVPKQTGPAELGFVDAKSKVILHDGQGTEAQLHLRSLMLDIVPQLENAAINLDETPSAVADDHTPPVILEAQIIREHQLLLKQNVLVFSVKDVESGVAFVEVREGGGAFERAESPFVLKNQALDSIIVLRVVDNAGNERMLEINPSATHQPVSLPLLIGVLLVAGCVLLVTTWYRKRHGLNQ